MNLRFCSLNKKLFIFLCFGLSLQSACIRKDIIVAEVGQFKITRQDVDLRDQIIKLGTPAVTESYGRLQLVKAYTNAQVLINNGFKLSDDLIKGEEQRIDKNTKMPEALATIKNLFKGDMDAYRRVYVLPSFVDSFIFFGFFNGNTKIQDDKRRVGEELLSLVLKRPSEFKNLSKQYGFVIDSFRVSEKRGIISVEDSLVEERWLDDKKGPIEVQQALKEQEERQASVDGHVWTRDVIAKLKPGGIHPKLIDRQDHWNIARYLRPVPKVKNVFEIEAIRIPKRNFDEWFAEEQKKVAVKLID